MLDQSPNPMFMSWTGQGNLPRTFHGLINELTARGTPEPDAYILTAYSAIPLADAFRGYYQELGVDTPLITYVHASSSQRNKSIDPNVFDHEVARLQEELKDCDSPCIVDEYTNRGITISRAIKIIAASGNYASIHTIEGQWYHNASRVGIDLGQVSSTHASFMHEIGRKAAILARSQQQS